MRTRIIEVIFFLLLGILFLHPVNSGDFFHHITTGRDIVATRSRPRIGTWTFTANGKPWIAHSWGAGVLFYFVHTLAGYDGISVLFAGIGVLTALFCYLSLKNLKVAWLIRLIIVFVTASIISLRWPSRPEVFGPFFVSFLLYLLPQIKDRRRAYLVPLIIWIWSIIYGSSVFLGIGIILIYGVRLPILLLSLVAALANGYGLHSFFYLFLIPKVADHVGEWLPMAKALDPASPGVVLFYQYQILIYSLYTLTAIMLIVWFMLRNRMVLKTHIFFLSIFFALFLPFVSVRFINLAPVLAAPLIALLIARLTQKTSVAAVIIFLCMGIAACVVRFATYPVRTGLSAIPFGSSSLQYLSDFNITGNIFASQELGGYIKWRIPTSYIFYDTRDDLYISTNVITDMKRLSQGQTDVRTLLRTYNADIVIGEIDHAMYTPLLYLNTWKLVHVGESTFVAVQASVAEKYGLITFEALDPTRVPPAKPGKLTEAKAEMASVLNRDASAENYIRMAEILLALGKTQDAIRMIEHATIDSFQGMISPIVNLGLSEIRAKFYLADGRCNEAKTALIATEKYRTRPFIFSPHNQLFSAVNRYWGQYYIVCERDIAKARDYLLKYAIQTTNARERRNIEELLDTLNK